jgi:hypothetical protein
VDNLFYLQTFGLLYELSDDKTIGTDTSIPKALTMPLNARQIGGVKSLLRRAAALVEDALNVADAAGDRPMVIRLNSLRRAMLDEIADLDRAARE